MAEPKEVRATPYTKKPTTGGPLTRPIGQAPSSAPPLTFPGFRSRGAIDRALAAVKATARGASNVANKAVKKFSIYDRITDAFKFAHERQRVDKERKHLKEKGFVKSWSKGET